jgi:uncharacterized protein DUF4304
VGGTVDSKAVNRALREIVWSDLQTLGFTRRTPRTAWRDRSHAIQVVNFQSFNRYLADAMGATTFSFAVNLGVFYPAIADRSAIASFIPDRLRPPEWHCQARKHLGKGLAQPNAIVNRRRFDPRAPEPTLGSWVDRPDVWYVRGDGSNVNLVVADAHDRILDVGIPWLDRLSDLAEARRHFQAVPNSRQAPGIVDDDYGGAIDSPKRWLAIGALSAALDDVSGLRWAIEAMAAQPYFLERPADLDALRFVLGDLTQAKRES